MSVSEYSNDFDLPVDLLEGNNEQELASDEHEEMMDFVRSNDMMSLVKIKMRIKLKQSEK